MKPFPMYFLMIPTHSGDVPFIFESRYYLLKYSQQCESDNITDIDDSTSMATLLIVSHSHTFSSYIKRLPNGEGLW